MYKKVIGSLYLIGVLIIGMSLYTKYSQYKENIVVTNTQLLGLAELDKLYKINISLKKFRGLKQYRIQPKNLIEEEFLKISYLLTKLNDEKLEKEISSLLSANQFYSFNKTINKIELKIINIGKTYRLFEKLNKDDYNLISSIIYTLPQLIESIGTIRGKGTYYLTHNVVAKTDKYLLNSIFDKFYLYQDSLLLNDEESALITVSLKRVKLHLEQILDGKFELDSIQYFEDLTVLIGHLNNYYISSEQKIQDNLMKYKIQIKNDISNYSYILLLSLLVYTLIVFFIYRFVDRFFVNKKQERYISTIENELYGKLEFCDNVKEVSKECIQFLCKKIDAVNGLFYIVDTKNEKLSLSSTFNISPRHVNHILDFDEGVFAEVLESKTIQVINSSEKKEIDFGSFKTDVVKIVTIPIVTEYNNIIAVAQLSLISETGHYNDLQKVYEIMANNILKSQKNEENEKYFNLIDRYVITSTTNKDGIINYASKAFQNISGYSQEQLLGASHNILRHPDVKTELYQDMWDTIKSGEIWTKEFQNKKKDGSTYWVESTISPEIGFYGDIVGYTAIRQDITDRKTVEELSITDSLTSLYNRRHFDNELKLNLSLSKRMKTKLVFAMIDIDHFKQYNDTYGHQEGDETLKAVAMTLKRFFKRDIDMVFRLGGEEFGILFYVSEFEDALTIGNKLIKSIENLKIKHEKSSASKFVTISMGLFLYDSSDLSPLIVYKETDELLYEAKQNGRNQFFSNI